MADTALYGVLRRGLSSKLTMGNILTLIPPPTITTAGTNRALDVLDECLTEAGKEIS